MTDIKDVIEMIDRMIICRMWCAKYDTPECPAKAIRAGIFRC